LIGENRLQGSLGKPNQSLQATARGGRP